MINCNGDLKMNILNRTNILLPKDGIDLSRWSVIACDQFTSQPQYWNEAKEKRANHCSCIDFIIPEAELNGDISAKVSKITEKMRDCLECDIFQEYFNSYMYIERYLTNGEIRSGVICTLDLEMYDYELKEDVYVYATEETVTERIPARLKIRETAPIEMSHVILLCNDKKRELIESLAKKKNNFKKVYDFMLLEDGGHISGWIVDEESAKDFSKRLQAYQERLLNDYETDERKPLYVVGDGNHSLAAAKVHYENLKKKNSNMQSHPARYALVELENIYSDIQEFEPIHRIIKNVNPEILLKQLESKSEEGHLIKWISGEQEGMIYLDSSKHMLAIEALQEELDKILVHQGGEIDYIHGEETVYNLAKEKNSIGFILPKIEKNIIFEKIVKEGVFPRKTFSIGQACEKRYYLESRKIIK